MAITKEVLTQVALRCWSESYEDEFRTVSIKIDGNAADILEFLNKLSYKLHKRQTQGRPHVDYINDKGHFDFWIESNVFQQRDDYALSWEEIFPDDKSFDDKIADGAKAVEEDDAPLVNEILEKVGIDCLALRPECAECGYTLNDDDYARFLEDKKPLCEDCLEEDGQECRGCGAWLHDGQECVFPDSMHAFCEECYDERKEEDDDEHMFEEEEIQPASVMAL